MHFLNFIRVFIDTVKLYSFVCIALLLTSCGNKRTSQPKNTSDHFSGANKRSDTDTLYSLDTTIMIQDIPISTYQGDELNDSIAKAILFSYYKKKGYANSENLSHQGRHVDIKDDELVIDYDKIFVADINDNRRTDAIITFWMSPSHASGHCWQTHKALIVDTDHGYEITNEEFIPTNFTIDSVVKSNGRLTLFGYDYDCENHKTLQLLQITLTRTR